MDNWFLIYGPMKAGKTTRLQTFASMCKSLVVNHKKDVRFGVGVLTSHDKRTVPSYMCDNSTEFESLLVEPHEIVFLDEVHFHTVEFVEYLAKHHSGKKIYFSGLDKDFNGNFFAATEKLMNLIPRQNQLHLLAMCGCGRFAEFSALQGEKPRNTNILVGTNYEPKCTRCFYKLYLI